MNFFLLLCFTCGTALLPLLYVWARAVRALFLTRRWKQRSVEARARILQVQTANGEGRRVPFARLKVEVFGRGGEVFTADAEGFYPPGEIARLRPGAIVCTRYLPSDKTQVRLVKKPVKTEEPAGMFVKNNGEIIAAGTSPAQSPAARPQGGKHGLFVPPGQ